MKSFIYSFVILVALLLGVIFTWFILAPGYNPPDALAIIVGALCGFVAMAASNISNRKAG